MILQLMSSYVISRRAESKSSSYLLTVGHAAGGAVVEALRYKPEGRGINSRWHHWNFSLTIFPAAL
jgi:hypothetical protein